MLVGLFGLVAYILLYLLLVVGVIILGYSFYSFSQPKFDKGVQRFCLISGTVIVSTILSILLFGEELIF